ncbi:hypothetical protein KDW_60070 [Dictyobacter vulcani]|uniref:Polymerase nucleotidyl transferase domain-containing protein n=1 Tax=Dictyobacter vulcani TaxID=2607529 RepID=A0A5J4KV64_9CHLR|nr:nucleotidyltransferase domain-containing protein [Dictyobacter vulcani]GER91845.1 hypothetical protein KDW_60070 [Dictyobacter vulcani]
MIDQVEQLYTRAVQAFAAEPEVSEIGLFGSYAKGTHDRYSDIDLHVVSQDFDTTMNHLAACLAHIGQVLVAFPLTARVGYAAYVVLFEDYSPYTKLDLSIADTANNLPFADTTCVYHTETISPATASTYQPARFAEPLNILYDSYLGALRYIKYRQRWQHFSAYKFYRAQLDRLLVMCYHDISNADTVERLGILEYQHLDKHSASTNMQRYLYPENAQMMDRLYIDLLEMQTRTLQPADHPDHQNIFTMILAFLASESRSGTEMI